MNPTTQFSNLWHKYFTDYGKIEKSVINVIIAEFFIQLINVAFLSIQLIYMQKCGYSDYESAGYISFRFLGVLLLAVPMGMYLKGRNIKPLFVGTGTWQTGVFFVWANILNPQKMSANKTFIFNLVIYSFEFEPNP